MADCTCTCSIVNKQLWGKKPDVSGPNRKPFTVLIKRGELVRKIPEEERIPHDEGPPHNYTRHDDPSVTFYSDGSNLSPLGGAEQGYLEAVVDPTVRCHEYQEHDKLKWIMDLKEGDGVVFNLNNVGTVKGVVRYIGKRSAVCRGILFGIEIEVCTLYSTTCTCTLHVQFIVIMTVFVYTILVLNI